MPICPENIGHCYHLVEDPERCALCCWCGGKVVIRVRGTRTDGVFIPARSSINVHGQLHVTGRAALKEEL